MQRPATLSLIDLTTIKCYVVRSSVFKQQEFMNAELSQHQRFECGEIEPWNEPLYASDAKICNAICKWTDWHKSCMSCISRNESQYVIWGHRWQTDNNKNMPSLFLGWIKIFQSKILWFISQVEKAILRRLVKIGPTTADWCQV